MDIHFRVTKSVPAPVTGSPTKRCATVSSSNSGSGGGSAVHPSTPQKPTRPGGHLAIAMETPPRATIGAGTCSAAVNAVYADVQRATGSLGGNASGGAIYGEVTKQSVQRVLDLLREKCELGPTSSFIDIGSGLGKPNFHACVEGGLRYSVGAEIDKVRWHLSLVNLQRAVGRSLGGDVPRVMFQQTDITAAKVLDPFTHVYMFDTGFPPHVSEQIAAAFNASKHTKYLVCFHRPKLVLEEWGLEAEYVDRVQTSMSGSSEGHLCYIYRATGKRDIGDGYGGDAAAAAVGGNKRNVDPVFAESMRLLDSDMDHYLASMAQTMEAFHSQPRTRRGKADAKRAAVGRGELGGADSAHARKRQRVVKVKLSGNTMDKYLSTD